MLGERALGNTTRILLNHSSKLSPPQPRRSIEGNPNLPITNTNKRSALQPHNRYVLCPDL